MEDKQRHSNHSCHACLKTNYRRMKIRWIQILAVFVFAGCGVEETSAETLCGAKLVDALQFVCGDITFRRLTSQSNSRRFQKGIVEECCFVDCNLQLLEQYCVKPVKSKREAVPVPSPLTKDATRKHVTVKYSKYEAWQRKAAQRMRRGIPAILRTWTFRRPAEKLKAQ